MAEPLVKSEVSSSNPLEKVGRVIRQAWAESKVPPIKAVPLALAGALLFSACLPSRSPNASEPTAIPPQAAGEQTSDPALTQRQQEQSVIAAALPGILAAEEAKTKTIPPPEVGQAKPPLSPAEQEKFNQDFKMINDVVKQSLKPESIQNNPQLSYDYLLSDTQKMEQYRQADFLGDVTEQSRQSADPENQPNPEERTLSFLPEGGRGGTSIFVLVGADGRVFDSTVSVMLSPEGQAISQFARRKIPEGDLKKVVTGFYQIPEGVNITWETGPYDRPDHRFIQGTFRLNGKVYIVSMSSLGYSSLRVVDEARYNPPTSNPQSP